MIMIADILQDHVELTQKLAENTALHETIQDVIALCADSLQSGGKILFCGNGGSASDAEHLAAELSGRFYKNRAALAGLSLTSNTSHLTAVSNDFGYDHVYARGVEAHGQAGDVLIGLSTSGQSQNVLKAFAQAQKMDIHTVGICGSDISGFHSYCQYILSVPHDDTPRIQEMHILIGHILCEGIENSLFPRS